MHQRIVAAEILDSLPVDDPRAMRSRSDLRRIHRAMGTCGIARRALDTMFASQHRPAKIRVLELGAGDGTLMLEVARTLSPQWSSVDFTLLDRQALVSNATVKAYADVHWTAVAQTVDVFDWVGSMAALKPEQGPHWDLVVVHLFLHHFSDEQLAELMSAIATRTTRFFACEPRRSLLALAGSHLVGLLGGNAVTRTDAVLSVRAGFRSRELAHLWPNPMGDWQTAEYAAGPFSHCLRAQRTGRFA